MKVFTEGKGKNSKTFFNICDVIDENTDPLVKTKAMGKLLGCKSAFEKQSGRAVFYGSFTEPQIRDALNK